MKRSVEFTLSLRSGRGCKWDSLSEMPSLLRVRNDMRL
jgi:hypothetical protein